MVYKPHIGEWEEGAIDMANWPIRLYRKVGAPLLLVVQSMVESQAHMHIMPANKGQDQQEATFGLDSTLCAYA